MTGALLGATWPTSRKVCQQKTGFDLVRDSGQRFTRERQKRGDPPFAERERGTARTQCAANTARQRS